MKKIDVLILDDNFVIARKLKKRLFDADRNYRYKSGVQIFPHYIEIDNTDPANSAEKVNSFIIENNITYLLLDRGFGEIIDGDEINAEEFSRGVLYKDNTKGGFLIEELLTNIKTIKNNALSNIKGVIVYTYDQYRSLNIEGEPIKEEIVDKLTSLFSNKCQIDVLLAYSEIYKIAGIDLYEGYAGEGIVKIGKKENFILYGLFCGELLYHKLLQMISLINQKIIREKKSQLIYRILVLFLVFTSINIGANALYNSFFEDGSVLIGFTSLLFAIIIPLIILLFRPSLLIDIEK